MSDRLTDLSARKLELLQRSDALRLDVAQYSSDVEERLAGVDHVIGTVRRLASNPLVIAGGAVAMLAVGPRKLFRLIGRGFFLFTTARRIWQNFH